MGQIPFLYLLVEPDKQQGLVYDTVRAEYRQDSEVRWFRQHSIQDHDHDNCLLCIKQL